MPQRREPGGGSFPVSCDVIFTTKIYPTFLQKVASLTPSLSDPEVLKRAALRYEHCWLPLVCKERGEFIPPWDVYYVWHLHMLMPQNYKRYCERTYRKIIPHSFSRSHEQERLARIATAAQWNSKYPLEPYQLNLESGTTFRESRLTKTLCESDACVTEFQHQLSAPHYKDDMFLVHARERYIQFMHMIKVRAGGYVPSVDIELVWKSHMLSPVFYEKDTRHYFGRVIDLDSESYARDSIDGPRFIAGVQGTSARWREVYRTMYLVPGVVAKNVQCYSELQPLADNLMFRQFNDSCEFILYGFSLQLPKLSKAHFDVSIKRINVGNQAQELFKGVIRVGEVIREKKADGIAKVLFDPKYHKGVEINANLAGRTCVSAVREYTHIVYPQDHFDDGLFYNRDFDLKLDVSAGSDPQIELFCGARVPSNQPSVFVLDRGEFLRRPIPNQLQSFVTTPAWSGVEIDNPKACIVAEHSLNRKPGYLRLVGSLVVTADHQLAAIMLQEKGQSQLTTVAYSVNNDLLADANQVSDNCAVTFDPDSGDQAMIICNSSGDWGYCVAKLAEDKGLDTIKVIFHHVRANSTRELFINNSDSHLVNVHNVLQFDLINGQITLAFGCDQMMEYITLALAIGTVHMMTTSQRNQKQLKKKTQPPPLAAEYEEKRTPRMRGRREKATASDSGGESRRVQRRHSVFSTDRLLGSNSTDSSSTLKHQTDDTTYNVVYNDEEHQRMRRSASHDETYGGTYNDLHRAQDDRRYKSDRQRPRLREKSRSTDNMKTKRIAGYEEFEPPINRTYGSHDHLDDRWNERTQRRHKVPALVYEDVDPVVNKVNRWKQNNQTHPKPTTYHHKEDWGPQQYGTEPTDEHLRQTPKPKPRPRQRSAPKRIDEGHFEVNGDLYAKVPGKSLRGSPQRPQGFYPNQGGHYNTQHPTYSSRGERGTRNTYDPPVHSQQMPSYENHDIPSPIRKHKTPTRSHTTPSPHAGAATRSNRYEDVVNRIQTRQSPGQYDSTSAYGTASSAWSYSRGNDHVQNRQQQQQHQHHQNTSSPSSSGSQHGGRTPTDNQQLYYPTRRGKQTIKYYENHSPVSPSGHAVHTPDARYKRHGSTTRHLMESTPRDPRHHVHQSSSGADGGYSDEHSYPVYSSPTYARAPKMETCL